VACSNKNGHGKICLIIDYEGFQVSKAPPMSTTRRVLEILQRHYAERMYRAYVCNPPLYFRTFYAIIKPFVDPVTKQKVCFCSGKKGMEQIVDDMGGQEKAMRHLEKCAGGVEKLRPFDNVEYLNAPFNHAFDEGNLLK
jgi:FMN-dependent NADH-azoreductase